jgi:RNase H-like protein
LAGSPFNLRNLGTNVRNLSTNGGPSPVASTGVALAAKGGPPLLTHNRHTCVFDLEIALPVEECPNGWAGARRGECGLSALVIWDNKTDRYHLYDSGSLEKAVEHLNSADMIVSWNGKDFDIPIIEALSHSKLSSRHIDMLDLVWHALGQKVKGYKLGEVVHRTLGLEKTGAGEGAPKLMAQERWGELFDYCVNDVHITRKLWEHICDHLYIISSNGHPLVLMVPQ